VIVDAFVPRLPAKTVRTLYEDDGLSPAYQEDAYCHTPVTLERTVDRLALTVGEMAGYYEGCLSERAWVLRLHLPLGSQPGDLTLDGCQVPWDQAVVEGQDPSARCLAPGTETHQMPFRGRGTAPGPHAGPVLEVTVPQHATDKALRLSVGL
jgi:hypothetical protein